MKIFDLNVNNFGGLHYAKPLWKDFEPFGREYRSEINKFQNDSQE